MTDYAPPKDQHDSDHRKIWHDEAKAVTLETLGVMWGLLRETFNVEGPARLVSYRDLLYPQYADRFNTIDAESWAAVRKLAQAELIGPNAERMHPNVKTHMASVAEGVVPFGLRVVADRSSLLREFNGR